MPKMKRHKGLAKRVKITANGKVKYRKANMGHLMSGKAGKRRRRLASKGVLANKALARKIISKM